MSRGNILLKIVMHRKRKGITRYPWRNIVPRTNNHPPPPALGGAIPSFVQSSIRTVSLHFVTNAVHVNRQHSSTAASREQEIIHGVGIKYQHLSTRRNRIAGHGSLCQQIRIISHLIPLPLPDGYAETIRPAACLHWSSSVLVVCSGPIQTVSHNGVASAEWGDWNEGWGCNGCPINRLMSVTN